jgi:hypothetical protein
VTPLLQTEIADTDADPPVFATADTEPPAESPALPPTEIIELSLLAPPLPAGAVPSDTVDEPELMVSLPQAPTNAPASMVTAILHSGFASLRPRMRGALRGARCIYRCSDVNREPPGSDQSIFNAAPITLVFRE